MRTAPNQPAIAGARERDLGRWEFLHAQQEKLKYREKTVVDILLTDYLIWKCINPQLCKQVAVHFTAC